MNKELLAKLKQAYSHLGLAENVLEMHANALVATGFVTAENMDDVVSKQKDFLEGLQKYNDTRVSEAVRKAGEKAVKDAEEKARQAAEEAAKKAREEALKNVPDGVKVLVDSLKAELEAEKKASAAAKEEADKAQKAKEEEWTASLKEMKDALAGFRKENDDLKKVQAAKERQAAIVAKAKELGIPQYRIDEGFVIPDDADEAAYTTALTNIAKNIKANQLPSRGAGVIIPDKEVSKEEADSIAQSMVANMG